ncbi:pantoate--beta-alanine ligase [Sporosarcina sp. HYO08]|uniref:pantoate--beta-alanine ligase n=1 Tax=Sporosarcina sp. HYO08 TaxID=1759557 RepID=UPI0007983FD5|nr:pantoate--beta-alanine ligase [Sporosarcina sp. HYO08]KXH82106.1 pantoate--beta-alanine ligase [Sporosarcina sp. HYO08]
MVIVHSVGELREAIATRKRDGQKTVGFVPTMGFLHEGHIALAENARKQNDLVVMSIFVNPTQFGPGEDFEAYPRDEQRDIQLAREAGVDILFMPTPEEMYPHDGGIRILPGPQAKVLCGASRPTHFDGVLQVILKLFNMVDPDRAYFGLKDAQQLAIIETFVRDFNFRTKIVRVETVRESDGLAKSSRNVNLSPEERKEAPAIRQALSRGAELFQSGQSATDVEQAVANYITEQTSGQIDYVTMLTYPELATDDGKATEMILACAVKFQKTRLIDNILIQKDGKICSE